MTPTAPAKKKKVTVPAPGRKLSQRQAIEQVNKQFAKALERLAK